MRAKRRALLVVVVLGLVLAGCTSGTTGTDPENDGTPDAASVEADALAAMDDVETYRVQASENRHLEANVERDVALDVKKRVDRPDRKLYANQTASVMGRTSVTDIYLVNETVYQRNEVYVQQYNSEWISADASENFSRTWEAVDTLDRQQRILDRSAVSLNGTETVDGTEAYVLNVDPNESAMERLFAEQRGATAGSNSGSLSVTGANYTFYVDTETHRPVEVSGTLNMTVESRGRTIHVNKTFVFRYQEYGTDVSVTLPDGAKEDAVPIGGRLSPAHQRPSSLAHARPVAVR